MKNVLKDFPLAKRYYLSHPWVFFKHLFVNIKDAYSRITKGWCPSDVWNWDTWFLNTAPEMFRFLATNGLGYPGNDRFPTKTSWTNWLNSVADVLESVQEENWDNQNEYREKLHDIEKYGTPEQLKTIRQLYIHREKELMERRQKLVADVLTVIGRNFFSLWD